jgi:S-disulfanyl-L-cysteine oxidoreductase SoxD
VIAACGALAILATIAGQSPSRSVWDGVYTQGQAKRGESVYAERCVQCHGVDLNGGDSVPQLAGTDFLSTWNTKTVGDLFDRIRTSMPSDKPGTLKRQQASDILAYVLSVNKFPAGNAELDTDSQSLQQIQFDAFKQ